MQGSQTRGLPTLKLVTFTLCGRSDKKDQRQQHKYTWKRHPLPADVKISFRLRKQFRKPNYYHRQFEGCDYFQSCSISASASAKILYLFIKLIARSSMKFVTTNISSSPAQSTFDNVEQRLKRRCLASGIYFQKYHLLPAPKIR